MDQVLELKNIHYAYHNPDGETPAINGISFILNKGEFVAIVGQLRGAESQRFFLLLPDFSHRKKASLKSMGNTFTKVLQM